jgi:negative regulator of flagellin synthesis FlgM
MKIDPRVQYTGDTQQPENVKNTRANQTQSPNQARSTEATNVSAEDKVSLSSKHGEVQALTANLANVPEVRTDRVNALQQKVRSGQYQPDNQKVADAIVGEHGKISAKA